jgi:amidohydrolase
MAFIRTLREAAEEIGPGIVADRRDIHAHPELGYQERRTAALVAARLRDLGIEVRDGVGTTGVVGVIRGHSPGRTVLLRADMDALPIQEENEVPYASRTPGVMHACGHDAHTAILLGAARLLAERRAEIAGTVKLVFQPAEEGGAGALRMIEEGVLDDPPVDAAFGLHVDADRYVGQVALRAGPAMAAADSFTITITGRGGHAASPHRAVDPIVVGAQMITALQTLVSREVSPTEPAVVTVASLSAGTTDNVIPAVATLRGTVRTFSSEVRQQVEARLREIAQGIAAAMRATAEVSYRTGYPVLHNDPAQVELVRAVVGELLGPEAVVERGPVMGAEDFAFVLQRVPGAYLHLGVRNAAWTVPRPVHTAIFDLDEAALPIGAAVLTATALAFLAKGPTAPGGGAEPA